ncbi:MAG: hypothetical protein ACJ8AT_07290 [Hyalangium sp.]|uniref:hypothetical protein n=1 Tax=Hyalangium sp. TaxID=2028555 RepID=UPI00389AD510
MDPKRPSSLKRALRILLWLAGIVLVLVLAGLFLFDHVLRGKYEPAIAHLQQETTQNVGFFCEQQALLAADPWFHEPRTEGDVGPLLNAWVQWEGSAEPPKGSPLTIPVHLPQHVGDFKDWLTSQADVSTVDFSWMEKLHAYDRWDILKNAPVPPGQPFNMATAAIPNLVSLQLWAKFRLLQGLRTGQPLPAARDVRHLAWLMYRTDSLLGAMVAATVLKAEREAYQSMQAPPPEWQPMTTEQLERMRAVLMSSLAFSNIAVPVDVAKKARSCGEPTVSRCMALAEAGFMAKYLRPLAQDSYPGAYTALEADLSASSCATSLARTVWENGVTIEDQVKDAAMPNQPEWMRKLPRWYFGSRIAGIMLAIGSPSLERLHTFHKSLDAGDFKAGPGAPPASPP